jgi:hypothetical protein
MISVGAGGGDVSDGPQVVASFLSPRKANNDSVSPPLGPYDKWALEEAELSVSAAACDEASNDHLTVVSRPGGIVPHQGPTL